MKTALLLLRGRGVASSSSSLGTAASRRGTASLHLLLTGGATAHHRRRVSTDAGSASPGSSNEDAYLEAWQRKQMKPIEFYEREATRRHWFFHVDLQGRLYLEQYPKKNMTSCLKNEKFLDFFFKRVQRNDTGHHMEYPFVFPCGKELNFILPADLPIVFHDLVLVEAKEGPRRELVYGGTLRQAFDPSAVRISHRTGRLYHPLTTTVAQSQSPGGGGTGKGEGATASASAGGGGGGGGGKDLLLRPRFGLLRSQVGIQLMDRIHYDGDGGDGDGAANPVLEWEEGAGAGRVARHPIRPLPEEEEPLYGLPPSE